MTALEQSIENLYEAFAEVPKPDSVGGCECCIDEKELVALLAAPLRILSPEALSNYAASALLTVGSIPDYLYFLPRILEISAKEDNWWPAIQITARAISQTELTQWSPVQQAALKKLLSAVIDWAIELSDDSKLDAWLCAAARMSFPLRPFLAQVAKSEPMILSYFERNASCLARNKLGNSFWELPNEGHDEIVQWFKADPVRQLLYDTYGYVS
ncbi:MAG: hypothetical protein HOP19_01640 [Acidobacteria bacterium]|nr:hypothetical protein [Acidobacteriota bacterium]